MRLTNFEKETVINFNEAERTASIYTSNEALKRQLLELCRSPPGPGAADSGQWAGRADL